jgi:hypothetical protein
VVVFLHKVLPILVGFLQRHPALSLSFLQDGGTVLNGIKISQKKQKNKVFPTANTKESVKR